MVEKRIIWQYWETRDVKPRFIDELHQIAKRNAGAQVVQVTPETLADYLPDIPGPLFEIDEIAHKADMIRTLLVHRYGGMWLDSDAIVLSDLSGLFEKLADYEFVGFNDSGSFEDKPLNVRINCFLARPRSTILEAWIAGQHAKFPRTEFAWTEIGSALLDPIVAAHRKRVALLPFDLICPIRWNEVARFNSRWENTRKLLRNAHIVMLSNKSLQQKNPRLAAMSVEQLASEETLIGDIIRKALRPGYVPTAWPLKALRNLIRLTRI